MKTIISLLVIMFLGLVTAQSQEYLELILEPQENTTLQDIQTLAEDYFETRDKGRGSGYKQYKRWEYMMGKKVNADGRILNFSMLAWNVIKELNSENPPVERSSGIWTSMGPTSYTNGNSGYNGGLGRVNVIAFHPSNNNIIYIGVPAGGVWKTTNMGSTWTPMADMLASIGVSGIAVDHSNPNTVYILTGDGDGANTYSVGILKSTDGGATWNSTGLSWGVTSFVRGFKLLMHPTNSNIMYAATNIGIIKTTDGWSTWSNVLSGSFRDIEFKPGVSTTLYASTSNSFYRTTNSGSTWSLITSGLPTQEDRVELAVTANNANYVYYLAGPAGSNSFKGIYRSTDGGLNFSTMSTTPNILGYATNGQDSSSQSWYDLAIAADPGNLNTIITGGVNIWRSTNGGSTMNCITNWFEPPGGFQYVHADIHELVYNPLDNRLYCGSDGGVSFSSDHGNTWTNIWNGLQIMQFYRIAGVEANQNLLIGGTQDNGSNKYTGTPVIQHVYGADGMDCMIDYNNNNILYNSTQSGGFIRSTDGGANYSNIQPGGSVGAWVTPYGMDPNNPSIIYGGFNDVYRSTNMGNSWTNLGSDGRGALAVGIDNPARLYAANNNVIQTSANTGGSWTTVTGGWPNIDITSIAVDPANANRVWITLGGHTAGQKVYESMNAGSSWTNISGSLPNLPAHSVVYENTGGSPMDAIYVGMDVGVYYRSDTTSWTAFGTSLPNVPVYDLEINHTNSKIRAGTFGRGLWETSLFQVDTTDPVAICQDITVQLDINGIAMIVATDVDNGSFDNVGIVSYSVDIDTFTCSDVGSPVTVTLTVMDAAGNSDTCTALVTVEDNLPPTAVCQNITVSLDATGNITVLASDVDNGSTDNCGIAGFTLSPNTFDCSDVGANNVTLDVIDDSGNTTSCSAVITVEDITPPTAICQDLTVQLDVNGVGFITAAQVDNGSTDACGISNINVTPNTFDCNDVGTNTVTLLVTDVNGNTGTCSATITVEDNVDPVALCQDITVMLDINGNATITGADVDNGSNDACGILSLSVFPDTFDTGDIGPNNVTLTVTDNNGNTSTCNAVVTVIDYLDVDEHDFEKGVIVYPNPAGNQVSIKIPIEANLNISIFDLIGKLVYQKHDLIVNDTHTIDVSSLNVGMYFMEIQSEYGSITKKLLKK